MAEALGPIGISVILVFQKQPINVLWISHNLGVIYEYMAQYLLGIWTGFYFICIIVFPFFTPKNSASDAETKK
jgi:hypothetical protein